jgi:hypothetical protein
MKKCKKIKRRLDQRRAGYFRTIENMGQQNRAGWKCPGSNKK